MLNFVLRLCFLFLTVLIIRKVTYAISFVLKLSRCKRINELRNSKFRMDLQKIIYHLKVNLVKNWALLYFTNSTTSSQYSLRSGWSLLFSFKKIFWWGNSLIINNCFLYNLSEHKISICFVFEDQTHKIGI